MNSRNLRAAAAFWSAAVLSVAASEVSGVRMPDVVTVSGKELRLNGMGLYKEKIFFPVYVAGLYLEEPTQDAREAISADQTKRMVFSMLRDVGRERFVRAVQAGIRRNSGPEMPALQERLNTLEQALPDLRSGDVLEFTYLPGIGTQVRGEGREMMIQGKDFADALFSAWLGPDPVSGKLKRELLRG